MNESLSLFFCAESAYTRLLRTIVEINCMNYSYLGRMWKLIIAVLLCMVWGDISAQSFQLFDASSTLSAGDTIAVDISIEDFDISVPIGITNSSGNAHAVNVTRYEVDVLPNTSSYFCWGSCTGVTPAGTAPVVTPSGSVNIGAGATIPANVNGFVLHYDPNFQAGTSLFRIKFFDVNNPSDSASMFISIRSMDYTGLESAESMSPFHPNPVGQTLILETGSAELYDLSGKKVAVLFKGSNDLSKITPGRYVLRTDIGACQLHRID